jgi:hypothetical protein
VRRIEEHSGAGTVGHRSLLVANKGMAEMVVREWLVLGSVKEVYLSMLGSDEKDAGHGRCTSTDLGSICDH